MTSRWLLLWDGARVTTVATFPGDRPYAALFAAGAESYVWSRAGISRLQGARLEPVPGGEAFRGRRVDQILPADGGLLVSVRGEGLFLLRDGKAEPFAPEASRWTAAKRILEGLRLADGRWALGSVLGGLLLLRPDGTVDQVIDTAAGLPDDFVTGLVTDREGALWLSLNNGLARVEVASPLSVLDRRTGLQGEHLQRGASSRRPLGRRLGRPVHHGRRGCRTPRPPARGAGPAPRRLEPALARRRSPRRHGFRHLPGPRRVGVDGARLGAVDQLRARTLPRRPGAGLGGPGGRPRRGPAGGGAGASRRSPDSPPRSARSSRAGTVPSGAARRSTA